jgi:hypothetical protein
MPAGELVTVPEPVPARLTFKGKLVGVAPDGANATPRKFVLAPADARVEMVPVMGAL